MTIAILAESYSPWERRAPIVPNDVDSRMIVQPSRQRVFADSEYEARGATVSEDVSAASVLVGIKPLPAEAVLPDKTYALFPHVIKGQAENMPLLHACLARRVRLIDFECIREGGDPRSPRTVAFGIYAGRAGVIDAMRGVGMRSTVLGTSTPFIHIAPAYTYVDYAEACESLARAGATVRATGFAPAVSPFVIAVLGDGAVARGAMDALGEMEVEWVDVAALPALSRLAGTPGDHCHRIYAVHVTHEHLVARKDGGAFDKARYYDHPDEFVPIFADTVAAHVSCIVTAFSWTDRFPKYLTARDLRSMHGWRLIALADLTCDVPGAMEPLVRATCVDDPFFVYDAETETHVAGVRGEGLLVLGTDILPTELPRDASLHFSQCLKPYVSVFGRADLPPELRSAVITEGGRLAPRFAYLADALAAQDAPSPPPRGRVFLVLGSGMCADAAVEYLSRVATDTVVVASCEVESANTLCARRRNCVAVAPLHVGDAESDGMLRTLVHGATVVLSMLPACMHAHVAEVCLAARTPLVTPSYTSPEMVQMHDAATRAGVPVLTGMGLDPGIDDVLTHELLRGVPSRVTRFRSLCGGVPHDADSAPPFRYKCAWSSQALLSSLTRTAHMREDGRPLHVAGDTVLHHGRPERLRVNGAWHEVEVIPNGDVETTLRHHGLEQATDAMRGTLRHPGWCALFLALRDAGLLEEQPVVHESWPPLAHDILQRSGENSLVRSALEVLGCFDPATRCVGATLRDAFAQRLQKTLTYEAHVHDMILMVVEATTEDGQRYTATFHDVGDERGPTLSRWVGVAAGIGASRLAEPGVRPGLCIPTDPSVYDGVKARLDAEGLLRHCRFECQEAA